MEVEIRWWVVLWVGVAVAVLGAVRRLVVVWFLVVWCVVWVSVGMEGPVHRAGGWRGHELRGGHCPNHLIEPEVGLGAKRSTAVVKDTATVSSLYGNITLKLDLSIESFLNPNITVIKSIYKREF